MRSIARWLGLTALVLACGGDSKGNGPGKTTLTYGGVFAGEDGTEAGNFSVAVVVEDSSGTGSFIVNGDPHTFTSITYDGTDVVASGAGFVFTGTADDTVVTGSYTSASGGGLFTGLRKTSSVNPVAYCGTHIGTRNGDPIAGAVAFVQGGSSRRGVFTSVLSAPFRGLLRSSASASAVTLDTLNGTAALTVGGTSFTGTYAMVAGDTGDIAGARCRSSVTSPIMTAFDGVVGSFDGLELGSLSFSLSSTGLGSTGTYNLGAVAKPFVAVISGVNNTVAAFDTGFSIIASLDTGTTMEGRYAKGGSIAGRLAGLAPGGMTNIAYCGTHTLGGAFSFIFRSDSVIFGLYTGGTAGSAFQGEVTGNAGDDGAQLETEPGPITVLPQAGGFGGFWAHSTSGGTDGSLSGNTCP